LAWVACGRLDGFWEFGLNAWDMAGGVVIISEAGGRCSDMGGGVHSLRSPHLLADNGLIHEEALAVFGEVFRGRYPIPLPELA
jgi:myo-inositol-1(or 4)-monophosphatase